MEMPNEIFTGNRFATFTDLDTEVYKDLFADLRGFSDGYLKSMKEHNLWPSDYYWPPDSLMTNTRVWEYPYVIDVLQKYGVKGGKLLDIGSALTFFPYYLSNRGYATNSIDNDPKMVEWSTQIREKLKGIENPGFNYVEPESYSLGDVTALDFEDETFDIVTNVSVLEHLPFELIRKSVDSIHQKLKKGGIFICTLDCLIDGPNSEEHMPLTDKQFREFLSILTSKFELVEQHIPCSPDSLITNEYKPLGNAVAAPRERSLKQKLAASRNAFLGRGLKPAKPLTWTAYGFTLRR